MDDSPRPAPGRPLLVVVTADAFDPIDCTGFCEAVRGVVDALVLRWTTVDTAEQFDRASLLARSPRRPALWVSDRPDVAWASGCEGVQLKERSLPPAIVRAGFPGLRVGASRHDEAGVRGASAAHHLIVSPFAATPSKPGARWLGEDGLRRLVRVATAPVIALGGIGPDAIEGVLRAGASGIAVRSFVSGAPDPVRAAGELRAELDRVAAELSGSDGPRP